MTDSGPGEPERLVDGAFSQPTWAPDGRYLSFQDGAAVRVVSREGGSPRLVGSAEETQVYWYLLGDWAQVRLMDRGDEWLVVHAPTNTVSRVASPALGHPRLGAFTKDLAYVATPITRSQSDDTVLSVGRINGTRVDPPSLTRLAGEYMYITVRP